MSNPNCPCRRRQRLAAPGPASAQPCSATCSAAAAECASAFESAPLRAAAETEMRICRYTNPIPIPIDTTQSEVVCLLRRQNELLSEILAALLAGNAAQA